MLRCWRKANWFLLTDGQSNLCDPLENSAERGHLQVEGAVAIWRPMVGTQRSVLYCAHGVWHRLGGGSLPYGEAVPSAMTSFSSSLSLLVCSFENSSDLTIVHSCY